MTRFRCFASGPWPAKRQRSRRVRPFAPKQPPEPLSVPAQPAVSAPSDRPALLSPPAAHIPADEVALVRPYYAAHERTCAQHEAERRQRAAADRLTAWGADLGTLAPPCPSPPDLPTRPVRIRPGRPIPVPRPHDPQPPATVPAARPAVGHASRGSARPQSGPSAPIAHVTPPPGAPHSPLPDRLQHLPHLSRLRMKNQQQRKAQEVAV
ncbi:hypothetical protein [Nocardiopsis salina]|uniref:hypothetical protein n=1 Tax=Nocardiopsis salina TaxID=245836 RepID=UPI000475510B|nr:hypothetical protein [Nocardiopsis salina]